MKFRVALAAVAFVFGVAATATVNADILWDNGPLSTGPLHSNGTSAPAGTTWSELQNTNTLLGSGAQNPANHVADDFTLAVGANIDTLSFFTYQTGSPTTSTITGLFFEIFNGDPSAGGTVIFGDQTTNMLTSTGFADMFRTGSGSASQARPIMSAVAGGLDIDLTAGTYWIEWSLTGSLASGPWAPVVTLVGLDGKAGANAQQNLSGTYADVVDAGSGAPQDFPFIVEGTAIPEPASACLLGVAMIGIAGWRRRRS